MVKKPIRHDDFDEDDSELVVDKKSKRKMAKAAIKATQQQQAVEEGDDTMSRMALLCQENRWREAVILCRTSLETARSENKEDVQMTLEMALPKLEFSLRRQQAAALIIGSKALLQKEYHLDVGE